MDSSHHHQSVSDHNIISLHSPPESILVTEGTSVPCPSSPSGRPKVKQRDVPRHVQLQWNCPFETVCVMTFDSQAAFNTHLHDVHTCHPYRCLIPRCTASFMNRKEIGTHLKSSHSIMTNFTCISCLKIYSSYAKLRAHYFGLHATGLFRCSHPDCTQICTTRMQSRNHYRAHQPDRSVICTVCGKTLKRGSLPDHLLTHTANKQTYQCTTCQVSFTQLTDKKRHEETHREATLHCGFCDHKFGGQRTLKQHVRIYHREKWISKQEFRKKEQESLLRSLHRQSETAAVVQKPTFWRPWI